MRRVKHFLGVLLVLGLILSLPPRAFAADRTFTDVSDGAWYAEAVQYVCDSGMMTGSGSTETFMPDSPTSRAMLVTILHRLEGTPAATGASFTDVPAGQYYTDAVAWASVNEIVTGDGGHFRPNDPITREQFAAILYRYANYKGYDTTSTGDLSAFPDGNAVSVYAAEAMRWAVGTGILQGTDGKLSPGGGATRAQAATMLMRFGEDIVPAYTLTVISAMDVMCEPSGILFLADGSFLVTDTYSKVIWRVDGSSSAVYAGASKVYAGGDTVADPYGQPIGGYNDAALADSYFKRPWAIAPFLDGYAVSDTDNNVVRLIRAEAIETVNGSTAEDLAVTDLGVVFNHPTGLATDEAGNLYVSDTNEGAVRKITPEGNVTTFASGLMEPMGLCWKNGTLYIAEAGANRIVKTTGGSITAVAGSGEDSFADGPAAQAAFSAPQGVTVGNDGTIYVSDTANSAVRRIQNGVVTTIARRKVNDLTSFIPNSPAGLAVRGNQIYVCDTFGRRVFVISLTK